MRVVVTGGAGFIGSWTVEALVDAGHEALVYDSLITGQSKYLARVQESVRIVRGKVQAPIALQRAVRDFKPDAIIHLAARVSVPLSLSQALRSHDDNTRGTLAVLEAARANNVRRVVLASSAAVYGSNPNVPLREDAVLQPLSPYALHKRVSEDYARLYSELYGIETVALRYFNVFGPRQDPSSPYSGVIARFIDAARNKQQVTVHGDGSQTRDFIFVEDVARVNLAAVSVPLEGHHVVNVATGKETSIQELLEAIDEALGERLVYQHGPARLGDIGRSSADIACLRTLLGVEPEISLTEGLRRLVNSQ